MSILQADGIQFGNSTVINTKYFVIPKYVSGTPHEMFFYEIAAPSGWSKSTSHNNKALRVVTGNGRGTGGTSNFTTIFNSTNSIGLSGRFSGSVGNTTLTLQQIPSHSHTMGRSFSALTSGGSSPFRTSRRQPRGYSFRASRRIQQNNRVNLNARQPVTVRAINNVRVSLRQRRSFRVRQPRTFRSRAQLRSRNPFRQPRTTNARIDARSRNPFNVRVDAGRSRNPFRIDRVNNDRRDGSRQPFTRRQPVSFRQRRSYRQRRGFSVSVRQRRRRGGARRRRPFRQPRRARARVRNRRPVNQRRFVEGRRSVRRPVTERSRRSDRQRRQTRATQPRRQRRQFRQPRSYNFRVSVRQRRDFRQRRNVPYRVRYPSRSRFPFRQPRSYRFTTPQRNPFTFRQPRTYRITQRYPSTNNRRVVQRTLTPGGQIRANNTQAPATSSTGGGQAHNHGFSGNPFTSSQPLSLRLQYIDIILCRFDP